MPDLILSIEKRVANSTTETKIHPQKTIHKLIQVTTIKKITLKQA